MNAQQQKKLKAQAKKVADLLYQDTQDWHFHENHEGIVDECDAFLCQSRLQAINELYAVLKSGDVDKK